ncbi:hypothetical protein BBJ28_00009229 [Nothophytophthora sp. Chile5]|nr:hypothetical protein BBJ28_00009229 [Nothophytophthora sp. Chile5]
MRSTQVVQSHEVLPARSQVTWKTLALPSWADEDEAEDFETRAAMVSKGPSSALKSTRKASSPGSGPESTARCHSMSISDVREYTPPFTGWVSDTFTVELSDASEPDDELDAEEEREAEADVEEAEEAEDEGAAEADDDEEEADEGVDVDSELEAEPEEALDGEEVDDGLDVEDGDEVLEGDDVDDGDEVLEGDDVDDGDEVLEGDDVDDGDEVLEGDDVADEPDDVGANDAVAVGTGDPDTVDPEEERLEVDCPAPLSAAILRIWKMASIAVYVPSPESVARASAVSCVLDPAGR